MGCFQQQLTSDVSKLQESGDRARRCLSVRLSSLDRFLAGRKCVGTSDDVISEYFNSDRDGRILDLSRSP